MTVEDLEARLVEAGVTLLSMSAPGLFPSIRVTAPLPVVHDWEAYGWTGERVRAARPSPSAISRMDEVLGWINAHLPAHPATLKRIVHARMLVHPVSGKHLYPWRRLAAAVGADHKAVQRWHAQALRSIVKALAQPPQKMACVASGSRNRARIPAEPLL